MNPAGGSTGPTSGATNPSAPPSAPTPDTRPGGSPSAAPATGPAGGPAKIIHTPSGLGSPIGGGASGSGGRSLIPPASAFPAPPEEIATAAAALRADEPVAPAALSAPGAAQPPKQIHTFGDRKRHEDSWTRTPNTTGTGAIHVKTFHSKLTDEAMNYLDQQINEWLDAHPQYEVKFSSATIGDFTGKLKEPHVIVQVWV